MSREEPGKWPLTNEEVTEWLESQKWQFAHTLAHNPHFYTLKRKLETQSERRMFVLVVHHIRENGYDYKWGRYRYVQYRAGEHDYWTMGAPLESTALINRKKREQTMKDEAAGKAGGGPMYPEQARAQRGE